MGPMIKINLPQSASASKLPITYRLISQDLYQVPSPGLNSSSNHNNLSSKRSSRHVWRETLQLQGRVLHELRLTRRAANAAQRHIVEYEDLLRGPTVFVEDDEVAVAPASMKSFNVHIEAPRSAILTALCEYETCHAGGEDVPNRLVLWVDASVRSPSNGRIGIAVVHKLSRRSERWITKGYGLSRRMSTDAAEALAITQALQNALCMPDDMLAPGATVVVYSDSEHCLSRILHRPAREMNDCDAVLRRATSRIGRLRRRGFEVHLHYVPSHQHVPGNMLADQVAKYASRRQPCQRTRDKGKRVSQ